MRIPSHRSVSIMGWSVENRPNNQWLSSVLGFGERQPRRGGDAGGDQEEAPAECHRVEFEHSINAAIKKLRLALGDSADEPHYVETVARRGYRLMARASGVGPGPTG